MQSVTQHIPIVCLNSQITRTVRRRHQHQHRSADRAATPGPNQRMLQGVSSMRRSARSTVSGSRVHQAVNVPGKAIPRVSKIPNIAVMSDIITPFFMN
jgi:hypothetical protein